MEYSEGDVDCLELILSVAELEERIRLLRGEIARLEAELSAKGASKSAAEALFRR